MSESEWIKLLIKYKGKCKECGKEIPVGEYALWSRSSKVIKHVECEAGSTDEILVLDCFICGKPAGCRECGFESDCNRAEVSQACVCNECFSDKNAYENYQAAFLKRMQKIAKLKI